MTPNRKSLIYTADGLCVQESSDEHSKISSEEGAQAAMMARRAIQLHYGRPKRQPQPARFKTNENQFASGADEASLVRIATDQDLSSTFKLKIETSQRAIEVGVLLDTESYPGNGQLFFSASNEN